MKRAIILSLITFLSALSLIGLVYTAVNVRERNDVYHNAISPVGTYCPGETISFSYSVNLEQIGLVEITSSWCEASRGTCLLAESQISKAVITKPFHLDNVVRPIAIPSSLQPEVYEWEYRQAVMINGKLVDLLAVPFTLRDDCEVSP